MLKTDEKKKKGKDGDGEKKNGREGEGVTEGR